SRRPAPPRRSSDLGPELAHEQLVEKGSLVGGAARGVELDAMRIGIASQRAADALKGLLPGDRHIAVRFAVMAQRVGQPADVLQLDVRPAHSAATGFAAKNSGVVRLPAASQATALAPFSQNSNEDVCFGFGQAQPGQSKPCGWLTCFSARSSSAIAICRRKAFATAPRAGQPPAGQS